MIEPLNANFLSPTKRYRRLSVLLAIQDCCNVSQHKMGTITHLSSSMVNNYIKELEEKGLISVSGNTNRTLKYHLTVAGQDALMSLLLSYSSEIIQLYGGAKRQLVKQLNKVYGEGIRSVVLFGAADTAEVVFAAMKDTPLRVSGVVDSDLSKQGKVFNGLTIQAPEDLKNHNTDAVVITSFGKQQEIYEDVLRIVGDGARVVKLSNL